MGSSFRYCACDTLVFHLPPELQCPASVTSAGLTATNPSSYNGPCGSQSPRWPPVTLDSWSSRPLFPPTLDRAELCDRQIIASVTVCGFRGDGIKGLEASASLSFGLLALRKPAAMSSGHSGGPMERPTWKGAEACSPQQPNQPPRERAASGVGPAAQPGLPMSATQRTVRPQPHAQPQGGTAPLSCSAAPDWQLLSTSVPSGDSLPLLLVCGLGGTVSHGAPSFLGQRMGP